MYFDPGLNSSASVTVADQPESNGALDSTLYTKTNCRGVSGKREGVKLGGGEAGDRETGGWQETGGGRGRTTYIHRDASKRSHTAEAK